MTAGLLVVLLLCGAGLAGACALRCGLTGPCGHGWARQAMAVASAQCHEMNAPRELSDSVSRVAMDCGHAITVVAVADESGMVPFGIPHVAVVSLVLPLGIQKRVLRLTAETPPRSISGSPHNLVSIRV